MRLEMSFMAKGIHCVLNHLASYIQHYRSGHTTHEVHDQALSACRGRSYKVKQKLLPTTSIKAEVHTDYK